VKKKFPSFNKIEFFHIPIFKVKYTILIKVRLNRKIYNKKKRNFKQNRTIHMNDSNIFDIDKPLDGYTSLYEEKLLEKISNYGNEISDSPKINFLNSEYNFSKDFNFYDENMNCIDHCNSPHFNGVEHRSNEINSNNEKANLKAFDKNDIIKSKNILNNESLNNHITHIASQSKRKIDNLIDICSDNEIDYNKHNAIDGINKEHISNMLNINKDEKISRKFSSENESKKINVLSKEDDKNYFDKLKEKDLNDRLTAQLKEITMKNGNIKPGYFFNKEKKIFEKDPKFSELEKEYKNVNYDYLDPNYKYAKNLNAEITNKIVINPDKIIENYNKIMIEKVNPTEYMQGQYNKNMLKELENHNKTDINHRKNSDNILNTNNKLYMNNNPNNSNNTNNTNNPNNNNSNIPNNTNTNMRKFYSYYNSSAGFQNKYYGNYPNGNSIFPNYNNNTNFVNGNYNHYQNINEKGIYNVPNLNYNFNNNNNDKRKTTISICPSINHNSNKSNYTQNYKEFNRNARSKSPIHNKNYMQKFSFNFDNFNNNNNENNNKLNCIKNNNTSGIFNSNSNFHNSKNTNYQINYNKNNRQENDNIKNKANRINSYNKNKNNINNINSLESNKTLKEAEPLYHVRSTNTSRFLKEFLEKFKKIFFEISVDKKAEIELKYKMDKLEKFDLTSTSNLKKKIDNLKEFLNSINFNLKNEMLCYYFFLYECLYKEIKIKDKIYRDIESISTYRVVEKEKKNEKSDIVKMKNSLQNNSSNSNIAFTKIDYKIRDRENKDYISNNNKKNFWDASYSDNDSKLIRVIIIILFIL